MENYIIIALLLVLIFKDDIKVKFKKEKQEPINEEELEKQKQYKEQFDRLMDYSINNAIESKKVN